MNGDLKAAINKAKQMASAANLNANAANANGNGNGNGNAGKKRKKANELKPIVTESDAGSSSSKNMS